MSDVRDPAEGSGSQDDTERTTISGSEDNAESNEISSAPVAAAEEVSTAVEDEDTDTDGDDEEEEEGEDRPLETEAEIAADYLEELLDIADLDGDIDTYIEGDRAHVSIVSDSTVLVGPDGAVLDALQELTRLAVMTETGDRSRLMLDVAGYREQRRVALVKVADRAVQAIRDGQPRVALDPMNPFERKIVHDAVAAAGMTSESEGQEPQRHVVVLPAS